MKYQTKGKEMLLDIEYWL